MIDMIRNQEKNNQQLRDINNEQPVASLSLRITADQAIVTAGSVITWDAEIRNLLFTWSGTDITIPNDGMYFICYYMRTSTALTSLEGALRVIRAGITYDPFRYELVPAGNNGYVFSFLFYFLKNDSVQVRLFPSANTNILNRPELTGAGGQSGIFYIMQLSGAI